MNMLDVRSLYVTYLSEEERVEAVRGIDFSAEEGKVTGIVGESGSGKSTAMLAVMGLLDHKAAVEAEKVSLFGNTVRAGDNAAIIFQDPLKCLNPTVKIGRQIAETVRNRKKCTWREAKKRSEELLDSVGIRHPRLRMKQYPFELSGGMRQRVVIAIALACEPNLIVADEPTTALDAAMQVRVIRLLKKIVKETNTALLLVSHNMGVIAAACDYVYVMKDGKMIENGCADDIFYNPQTEYTKKLLSDATAEQLLVKEKVFAAQENPLFTVRHLKKRFQNEEGVNDVSFDICEGEVFALAGESGSGKTTLLKLAAGLLTATRGSIRVCGLEPGTEPKKRVSFLPERSCLPAGMRVREALEFFGDFYADFQLDKAAEMLKDLQIQPNDKLNALSKGTREKLQLALVMSRKAELYLLDEPIGGVDPAARDYILNTIIRNYNEDATMILSTHLIHDIEAVFDDVVMIGGGHIVLAGSVDAIREERDKSIDTIFREVFRCWGN